MYFTKSKNFHERIKTCFFPMLFLFAKHDFLIDTGWKKDFLKHHQNSHFSLLNMIPEDTQY